MSAAGSVKGKKTSKNKLKLLARREAQGDMTEQLEKKISSKGRKDYLIESEDDGNGMSERQSCKLDFSELSDQEREPEGEYEHGKIQWQRSPSEKPQGEDGQSEDIRREKSLSNSTTRVGRAGEVIFN